MTRSKGVALVTGGGRGIGAATSRRLAEAGWDVAISFRVRGSEAEEVAAACRGLGRRAVTVRADVGVEADVLALFAEVDERLGTPQALVNNAGTVPEPGLIATEIHAPGRLERLGSTPPLGRPGLPEEVAGAIAWLVSDEASYVTGATLDISGGR